MRKVISAEQMRLADNYTIQLKAISSIQLMERASKAFVDEFLKRVDAGSSIHVIVGTGNNGGDGLAIARLLKNHGFATKVSVLEVSESMTPDCQSNLERLNQQYHLVEPGKLEVGSYDVIIDAVFGSGLNRPVVGAIAEDISAINKSSSKVISVDIPSGLFSDHFNLEGEIIQADLTLTFQRPKLTFLIPETGSFVGEWVAVDIGLDESFIESQASENFLICDSVLALLPKRKKFQHKGDFGRVQIFAGSLGKIGAAFFCGKAVMRTGAGLLTMHVPSCGMSTLQSSLPEAMLSIDKSYSHMTSSVLAKDIGVVCVGPGLGTHKETVEGFANLLASKPKKLVLDADALNILSEHPDLIDLLPEGTILTPHVGEFHRIFGTCTNGFSRLEIARKVASQRKLIIVLKGAHTAVICSEGSVFFNTTGNVGMATAGSGDVLAGIITGLLAQGLPSDEAAILGVFLHGKAGDIAARKVGEVSLMASDLLSYLPIAIRNE